MSVTTSYYGFDIDPAAPIPGELVSAWISAPGGCLNGDTGTLIDVPGRTIRVTLYHTDVIEPVCPRPTPYSLPLGGFPRGTYTVLLRECTDSAPPEIPPCDITETRQLRVGGGDPIAVPDISAVGAMLLALTLLAAAALRRA